MKGAAHVMEDKFAAARREFPALETYTYLDTAGRNPMSNRVRAGIEGFLDARQSGAYAKPLWFNKVEETRKQVAQLVDATPGEIALMKNTSEGLNAVAAAVDWQEGDNVIVAPEVEHPNNVYAWLNLRRRGVEVRVLAPQGPMVTPEQIESVIDSRTRILTIASVSFSTGGRADLAAISELCHESGALLIVDAAQSLGILDLDVEETGIDAFAAPTSKGLLGVYGLGVLYCKQTWVESLTPAFLARYSVNVAESEEEEVMGSFEYELHSTARRFETGNYNYLGVHAVHEGLRQLLELGTQHIESHVLNLSGRLTEGLLESGYRVISPYPHEALSSVVLFDLSGNRPEAVDVLSDYLDHHKVRHSVRRGRLRLSLHFYNNTDDVDRVLELLRPDRVPISM